MAKEKLEAIEIRDLADWEMLCVIQPNLKDEWASTHIGSFFVISPGEFEGAILSPQEIKDSFDCIEPNAKKLKLVKLVREEAKSRLVYRRRASHYKRRYEE